MLLIKSWRAISLTEHQYSKFTSQHDWFCVVTVKTIGPKRRLYKMLLVMKNFCLWVISNETFHDSLSVYEKGSKDFVQIRKVWCRVACPVLQEKD